MSSTLLESPARSDDSSGDTFTSQVVVERDVCVVRVAGELDCSSAAHAMRLCVDVGRLVVCVDLRELTFMDCGGYRGLVDARGGTRTKRRIADDHRRGRTTGPAPRTPGSDMTAREGPFFIRKLRYLPWSLAEFARPVDS